MATTPTVNDVLKLWFSERVRPLWFRSTPEFDAELSERFGPLYREAAAGALAHWEHSAKGALALVIVLDQFPLNMYRGRAESFATEAAARKVAERALARDLDQALSDMQKTFLYMPFMHSEALTDQDRCVALCEAAGLTENLKFAEHHREIVRRFGRFPHRNAALGRESRPEEVAYLDSEGAFRG